MRQLKRKQRHSGRDCRNPDAMDGKGYKHIHVFWMSAIPADMTVFMRMPHIINVKLAHMGISPRLLPYGLDMSSMNCPHCANRKFNKFSNEPAQTGGLAVVHHHSPLYYKRNKTG
jgi:hypothetical protein